MWSAILLVSLGVLAFTWLAALTIRSDRARTSLAYLIPSLSVIWCLLVGHELNAFARLFVSSLVLLYVFKGAALLRLPHTKLRSMNSIGLAYFSVAWPGLDATPFAEVPKATIEDQKRFAGGVTRAIIGGFGFLLVAAFSPSLGDPLAGWLAIFALLTCVHLGFSDALTEFTRALGWKAMPLFESPWRSQSLSNFWSQRWNRPFVELNKILFLPWLVRRFGMKLAIFCIFLISGLLHEMAISYPAQAGFGLPLLYFGFQGLMVLLERKLPVKGPLWVALIVLGPVPLLFHGWFRSELILPFVHWTHDTMIDVGVERALSILVWILGVAQFCILFASFQVPTRLRWKEELSRLSSLNRKVMWTYGAFIVYTIVSFGVLTMVLRKDILAGTTAGIAISTVIFLWWGLRLLTDAFYFKKEDWPEGPFMQIGHTMLNCLFTFVFSGYGAILAWHIWRAMG